MFPYHDRRPERCKADQRTTKGNRAKMKPGMQRELDEIFKDVTEPHIKQ